MLSAVNQGAMIASGSATVGTWLQVGFNFAVAFVVSSVGFLSAGRVRREDTDTDAADGRGRSNPRP